MALSESSAHEFDRVREDMNGAIDDIKDSAKETRADVSALRGAFADVQKALMGWKGEVEVKFVGIFMRLEALEKVRERGEKTWAERLNVVMNSVLVALVLWTLYKVTGIKSP